MYDLGILGGGQLARMSVMAAQTMGIRVITLDSDPNSPAAQVGPSVVGDIYDPTAIAGLMRQVNAVSFENEFIPANSIREACTLAGFEEEKVIPGIDTLAIVQDKLRQREAYVAAGVPSPRAVPIEDADSILFPKVLKARTGGYDGKGTRIVRTPEEFESYRWMWASAEWLAEEFVPFEQELAVMVTVNSQGVVSTFPTMVTEQKNNVCDLVYPSLVDASEIAIAAVEAVNGRGLFGVELFLLADGQILVNEIAPRPHNSGHYSLDWGGTSQFQQHVRVATCFPIDPSPMGMPTAMVNLIGQESCRDYTAGVFSVQSEFPEAHVHWYGKAESRPGRKMGHINVVHRDVGKASTIRERAAATRDTFYLGWMGNRS